MNTHNGTWTCAAILGVAAACSSAVLGDGSAGPMFINVDSALDFEASGSLTSVDTNDPPDGLDDTVWLDLRGANWVFAIRHFHGPPPYDLPAGAGNPGGFNQVSIEIKGGGLPSPPAPVNQFGHVSDPGPHAGETPNNLPSATDANPADVRFGAQPVRLAALKNVEHPPHKHFDFYQIATWVGALAGAPPIPPAVLPGPNNLLTGMCKVRAAHREKKPFSFPRDGAISSTPDGGSTVTYDAETKTLKLSIGWINGVSMNASKFGVVEPRFADDDILRAKWIASSIKLTKADQEGFHFGQGSLSLADQAGAFKLSAAFSEFLITNSSSTEPLKSFAVLSDLSVTQTSMAGSNAFLDQFIARNLFADGVTTERWAHWNGLDFAIVTAEDLVKLTDRFTKSVIDVPATCLLVANYDDDVEHLEEH